MKYSDGIQEEGYFEKGLIGNDLEINNIITVTENKWITVYAIDNVGNETISQVQINNIDKIPPDDWSFTISNVSSSQIAFGGETVDTGGSGIAHYYFSINDGNTWVGPQTSANYTFTSLAENTEYMLKMKAIDNAGNETISSSQNATTKKLVNLTFFVPIVFEDSRLGDEWTHRNHILDLYNTTQNSYYAYSQSSGNFTRYAYYEMRGIGVSNTYDSNGNPVTIPEDATITSGTLNTRVGVTNDGILYSPDVSINISTTGANITWSRNNVSTNTTIWSDNISVNFTSLPSRNSNLGFSVQGIISGGGISGNKRLMCSYIYAKFTAQWQE